MRRRRLFSALLAAAAAAAPWAPLGADEADGPILTRERRFAIPVEAAAGDPAQAEVRLYVSDDGGTSWTLNGRAKTPLESFEFAATEDKEYWFCVRSADASGRETTTEPMTAELRVAVDATPPKVDLTAVRGADGTIVVRWRLDDAHAAPEKPAFSYRSLSGGPTMHPIVPQRSKRQGDERNATGEIEFRPDDAGPVLVRAEATDRAENRSTSEVTVAEATGPAAADLPKTAGTPAGGESGAWTSGPTQNGVAGAPIPTPLPSPGGRPAHPEVPAASSPAGLATPTITAAAPVAATASGGMMRDPRQPLMVNSTSFELDYELTPGAVTNVEVWGTRDDGRTWVLLGADDDRASPTAVSVDRAGIYGFTVVVDTASAPARRPQPGDAPEIRVGVDLSIPTVRLTTAEPDENNTPCRLKINWEAQDDHLGEQAVSLSYAGSPAGPWLPLAKGVPNSGGYVCQFDPYGPDLAYLRIDVRDDAGNLGTFTTTAPIPIEKRPVTFQFAGAQNTEKKAGPKWFHVLR